jgi:hypothetical protein
MWKEEMNFSNSLDTFLGRVVWFSWAGDSGPDLIFDGIGRKRENSSQYFCLRIKYIGSLLYLTCLGIFNVLIAFFVIFFTLVNSAVVMKLHYVSLSHLNLSATT